MARRAEPVPIDGGHGFLAGEDVAIALVTGHTDASHHGQVRALGPYPRMLDTGCDYAAVGSVAARRAS